MSRSGRNEDPADDGGDGFDFVLRQGVPRVDGWRDLDRAVARWTLAHGGSPLLATVAGFASAADARGHSALWLDDPALLAALPGHDAQTLAAALTDEALIEIGPCPHPRSQTDDMRPFVLDGAAVQLRRHHAAEGAIAAAMAARATAQAAAIHLDDANLAALFGGHWQPSESAQVAAVRAVSGRRLFVLTGGPGTGKTTTVLKLLLAFARTWPPASAHSAAAEASTTASSTAASSIPAQVSAARTSAADATTLPRIRLAAPTGKAAQRLHDALHQGLHALASLPADWQGAIAAVQAARADTVHRLLGARRDGGGFRHHAADPLPAELVVVDESSMLDLGLLDALLAALPATATLVLVGDADQLTSVGTGSVLLDVVAALDAAAPAARVRLVHGFRADAVFAPLLDAVRRGDVTEFEQAWQSAGNHVSRHAADSHLARARLLHDWTDTLTDALAAAGAFAVISAHEHTRVQACLHAAREHQLLCPHRRGDDGAEAANALLEAGVQRHAAMQVLRAADNASNAVASRAERMGDAAGNGVGDDRWYRGRRVMMTRNDPALGLFNGDTGLCLATRLDDGRIELRVWFESAAGDTACRAFAPATLEAVQGAFAITVHKGQGSEYTRIAVLLPQTTDSPLLTRQMLYTALSRARRHVDVWGSDAALHHAIATPIRRRSRLEARLLARLRAAAEA